VAADFTVVDPFSGILTINSLIALDQRGDNSASTFILDLAVALTPDQAARATVSPTHPATVADDDGIYDLVGNPMERFHRVTDIGLGVVDPVWAHDGMHQDGGSLGLGASLHVFDGTGRLMDRDISLEAAVIAATQTLQPSRLFYDVDPEAAYLSGALWLPVLIPGLVPGANTAARAILPLPGYETGLLRDFLVPSSDPEIAAGADLEFLVKLGDLYCARVVRPFTASDPTSPPIIAPWVISIQDIARQKGGVTILNNVMNPSSGEKVVLSYQLLKSGTVTIQVFDLAGDLVKTLLRSSQAAGEYTLAWDGRNATNRVVAPGVYFIKVVGPGVSEIRKVLVTK
jgi:hypothetical protein